VLPVLFLGCFRFFLALLDEIVFQISELIGGQRLDMTLLGL